MKNFLEYLEETSEYLVQENMLQELGKMSGDMNESVQRDFINEKTSITCGRRLDGDIDPDASGFDLITLDDVGMIKGICKIYNVEYPIKRGELIKIGNKWKPYRSVATWYLWRSLDPIPVSY